MNNTGAGTGATPIEPRQSPRRTAASALNIVNMSQNLRINHNEQVTPSVTPKHSGMNKYREESKKSHSPNEDRVSSISK